LARCAAIDEMIVDHHVEAPGVLGRAVHETA
jgi:hypothetical protein